MRSSCIDYKATGFFSQTVIDYLEDKPELRPFYNQRPDIDGLKKNIANRKVTADRELLAKILEEQYSSISKLNIRNSKSVHDNISSLRETN
ncbi:MAG: bacillithiol biosynthesis BshC, partial [Bacteroidetes bacterium]|nr:bacillithiol biosynthesis BshC [Bacteroidota bacterium]